MNERREGKREGGEGETEREREGMEKERKKERRKKGKKERHPPSRMIPFANRMPLISLDLSKLARASTRIIRLI